LKHITAAADDLAPDLANARNPKTLQHLAAQRRKATRKIGNSTICGFQPRETSQARQPLARQGEALTPPSTVTVTKPTRGQLTMNNLSAPIAVASATDCPKKKYAWRVSSWYAQGGQTGC